jgi:hypothetical protein
MSCIHFSSHDPEAHCNAQNTPNLPWTTPEKRRSKVERLWRLGSSPVTAIRASAAGNADCPVRLMEVLAADPEPEVRAWVVRNLRVPKRLLKRLAEDSDPGIRVAAAFRLHVWRTFKQ